ncbi:Vesicle membrane receptor protein (v-SNARE) [Lithohypha guttulata]|uniref:Vesicle membrane receptor protein (v-SNARE) n=1 Tax=Lithohypha guttulata TaxID=1690604 RepID=UPI00315DB4E3
MADGRQEPYDPYMPSTGNAQGGNARTAALQAACFRASAMKVAQEFRMANSTATQARRTRRIPGANVFRRASMPVRIFAQDKGRSVQAKENMGFKFA